MTLTKAGLIKSVMENIRLKKRKQKGQQVLFPELDYEALSKRRATDLVESMLEIIKGRLERGDNVLIIGFGKFQARFKWARKGRNPKTGEPIILDSRRVVTFRPSVKLKDKINY
jgi:integration host factor subunit alpha